MLARDGSIRGVAVLHEIIHEVRDFLSGWRSTRYGLAGSALPISDLPQPPELCFPRSSAPVGDVGPAVKAGDAVVTGQALWSGGDVLLPCPVRGRVRSIGSAPDLRGGALGPAICVEPEQGPATPAFQPLDPTSADVGAVAGRLREAGLLVWEQEPRPLVGALRPASGLDALVVAAVDREPGVCSQIAVFRESPSEAVSAARLLARVAGATALLAVPESALADAENACGASVRALAVPQVYPESLPPLLALRAGAPGRVAVVALDVALDALRAVRDGLAPSTRVVTAIGPHRHTAGVWRVPLGTRLDRVLEAAGLHPAPGDEILAGGPLRGHAQYTTQAILDGGIDAVVLVGSREIVPFEPEPCVNCGNCIDACPIHLQVQLIGRYAEFGLFDRTSEFHIDQCIECGMCASVCTARRSLVQYLRLARKELRKAAAENAAAPPAAPAAREVTE